jgi:hypothetical protein
MFAGQCTRPDTGRASWSDDALACSVVSAGADADDDVARLARTDPMALLDMALRRCCRLADYQGTFTRQEVFNGSLQQVTVSRFKFRARPFSVALRVVAGAEKVDRMLYVEGRNNGKMLARPIGLARKLVPCVELDPRGEEVRKNSPRAITDFGLENIMTSTRDGLRESQARGGQTTEFLGMGELDGCKVMVIRASSAGGDVVIELDAARLVPLRVRRHDADGQLMGLYYFNDLTLDCGLGDSDFTREANGFDS